MTNNSNDDWWKSPSMNMLRIAGDPKKMKDFSILLLKINMGCFSFGFALGIPMGILLYNWLF